MILLPNGGAVFRGLLKAKFVDADRKIKFEAYLRRERENPDGTWTRNDANGISVAISAQVLENGPLTLKGIAKIESEAVRSVKKKDGTALEIFADPPVPESMHGNIVGIPYQSDDKETAELLAGELARQSELL